MVENQNSELFDSHAGSYKRDVNKAIGFTGMSVDFFTRVKASYIEDICSSHFGGMAALDALDVGCGVGSFHSLLAPRFGNLTGIDVSSASISEARERHSSVRYEVYDGMKLPYPDESFDVAFTICVMHHVEPRLWRNFSSEFRRVIKKGGLGLVFEHNPRNLLTMKAVNNCEFDADATLLRSDTTVQLLREAGFQEAAASFILTVPALNPFMRSVDKWFSGLPLGAQYYVRAVK